MERRVSLQSFEKPDIGTTFTTRKLILGRRIDWNILGFKSLIKHQNTAQHFIPQDRTLQPLQVITAAIILSSVLMISRELNRVTTFFSTRVVPLHVFNWRALWVASCLCVNIFFALLCFTFKPVLCLSLHHYQCEHGPLQPLSTSSWRSTTNPLNAGFSFSLYNKPHNTFVLSSASSFLCCVTRWLCCVWLRPSTRQQSQPFMEIKQTCTREWILSCTSAHLMHTFMGEAHMDSHTDTMQLGKKKKKKGCAPCC